MTYFLLAEVTLLLTLIAAKIILFPRLSSAEKSTLVERWSLNFSYEIVNRLLAFLLGTLALRSFSLQTSSQSGVFFVFYILFLDFIFYWRHRFYHRWLWSVHKTHHSDSDYDFTLSLRVHPVETLVQIGLFILVSSLMNISQWQMFFAAHIFTVQALISHLEYETPNTALLRALKNIFVLSDTHRFHHDERNPNCNFGFLFSFWDTIFGTTAKGQHNESI